MALRPGGIAALAVLVILATGGCGSSPQADRKNAVNDYITQVDAAEASLLAHVGQIDVAFGKFSVKRNPPAEVAALVRARSTIGDALRRVRAIAPPPDATRLHSEIVALLGRQESLAAELVAVARFSPRFTAGLQPLSVAAARLGRDLAAVKAQTPRPAAQTPGGAQLWTAAGCGACHTLKAAGSNGTAGPDLDQIRPTGAMVAMQVETGGSGMPSYRRSLTRAELDSLASYVAEASRGTPPPTAAATATAVNAALFTKYAAAFARYRRSVNEVAAALASLHAPPLLRPGLAAERAALARTLILCKDIAQAFSRHQASRANADIRALYATVAGVSSSKVRKQQNAATHFYDAQLSRLKGLATRIETERRTLVTRIG
jgi:mono/diheme cytochrome c family protein